MASKSITLHPAPTGKIPLKKGQLNPFIQHRVKLLMKKGREEWILFARAEEIFSSCQEELKRVFGERLELSVKGSLVAHLFNGEPFHDIDCHGVLNLTDLGVKELNQKGYEFQWTVLNRIKGLFFRAFSEDFTAFKDEESFARDTSYDLWNQQKMMPHANRNSGPANIHNLNLGEFEFTWYALARNPDKSERNFDFNSGALELRFDEKGDPFVQTSMGKIEDVIESVKEKKLLCINPEELKRKSIPRYLSKILFSSYCDENQQLLKDLIKNYALDKKDDAGSVSLKVISDVVFHFNQKGITPLTALLALYLIESDQEEIKDLSLKARAEFLKLNASLNIPQMQIFTALIEKSAKSELAWAFLLKASKISKTIHRNETCLHLEIPLDAVTPDHVLYLPVPLSLFQEKFTPSYPLFYFTLRDFISVNPSISAEAKTEIQALFKEQTKSIDFFPLTQAIFDKFSMPLNPKFIRQFFDWIQRQDQEEKELLPLEFFIKILSFMKKEDLLELDCLIFLKMYFRVFFGKVPPSLYAQELNPHVVIHAINSILENKKFNELEAPVQVGIVSVMKKLIEQFNPAPNPELAKIMINFYSFLFKHKDISPEIFLRAAGLCLDRGFYPQALSIMSSALSHATFKDQQFFGALLQRVSTMKLDLFIKFSLEHLKLLLSKEEIQFLMTNLVVDILKKRSLEEKQKCFELARKICTKENFDEIADSLLERISSHCKDSELFFSLLHQEKLVAVKPASFPSLNPVLFDFLNNQGHFATLDAKELTTLFKRAYEIEKIEYLKDVFSQVDKKKDAVEFFISIDFHELVDHFSLHFLVEFLLTKDSIEQTGHVRERKILLKHALDYFQKTLETNPERIKELKSILMRLHKAFIFQTVGHPLWEITLKLANQNSMADALDWIDVSLLEKDFLVLPHEKLYDSIYQHLEIELPFIQKYINMLISSVEESFDPSFQKTVHELIFSLISNAEEKVWVLDTHSKSDPKVVAFLSGYITHYFSLLENNDFGAHEQEILVRYTEMFFDASKMLIEFSCEDDIIKVLERFTHLVSLRRPSLQEFFLLSAKPRRFLLSALIKALSQKNHDLIAHVIQIYKMHFPLIDKVNGNLSWDRDMAAISDDCYTHLFTIFNKYIKENSHQSKEDAKIRNNLISLSHLFFELFSEITISIKHAKTYPEYAGPQGSHLKKKSDLVLRKFSDLIDIIGSKQHEELLSIFRGISKLMSFFDKETNVRVLMKLFQLGTAVLGKIEKECSIKLYEDIFPFIQMVHWIFMHDEDKSSFSKKHIFEFTTALKEASIKTPYEFLQRTHNVEILKTFYLFFDEKDLDIFIQTWIKQILSKGDKVSFEELCLFSSFGLMTHRSSTKKATKDGERFAVKTNTIDYNHFFEKESNITSFLTIFERAFRLYGQMIPAQFGPGNTLKVGLLHQESIFALFLLHAPIIHALIPNCKKEDRKLHLIRQFFDTIVSELHREKNILTQRILEYINHFFICLDPNQQPRFRFVEKSDREKNIKVFRDLIKKVLTVPPEERRVYLNSDILRCGWLNMIFKAHKEEFDKYLSKEEVDEIRQFFSNPLGEKGLLSQATALLQGAATLFSGLSPDKA